MSNILDIDGTPHISVKDTQCDADIIESLKVLLEEAMNGEIAGMVIATAYRDKTYGKEITGKAVSMGMLGAIDVLHHRLTTQAAD